MAGAPGTTRRTASPSDPRWRYTFTRNRPRPATLWATSTSPVSMSSSAFAAGSSSATSSSISAGPICGELGRLQPPVTRRCGGEPTLISRSEPRWSTRWCSRSAS